MVVYADQDVNWKVTQGDSFYLQIEYQDEDKVPIDLSGYNVRVEIKDKPGGRILSAICTPGDGIEVNDLADGIMNITISPAKTKKFNYPRASYQVQGTDEYGDKVTFLQGWFMVNAGTIN